MKLIKKFENYSGGNERLARLAKSYRELQSEWYSIQSPDHYTGPGSSFSPYDKDKIEKMMDDVSKEAKDIYDGLKDNATDEDKKNFKVIFEAKSEEWMSRDEMCRVLCRNGYEMHELEECSNQELEDLCRSNDLHTMTQEKKKHNKKDEEKWIQDAIKKPGSLRKKLGKKEDEKISKSEIDSELQALMGKDKDPKKKGVQGLNKKDLKKYRQLNLAKTLKGLKEHQETQNYMFFGNLQTIKRLIDEMLEMDESEVDAILSNGHNWALDHLATSKDDIEEVFNFLAGHDVPTENHGHEMSFDADDSEPSPEETEGHLANKDLENEMKGIKSFNDFKK